MTTTGVLAPNDTWDLPRVLPGLVFAPDVVCLNDGTEPDGIGIAALMTGIGVLFVSLGGWRLYRSARNIYTMRGIQGVE